MDTPLDQLKALQDEVRGWRTKCFTYADLFPASVFRVPESGDQVDPAAAAGVLARHVLTQFGIELAARVAELDREIANPQL